MTTLTLIFYGLVALVPSLNREGAMVVLPSAQGVIDSLGCEIPTHHPRIFQKKKDPKSGSPYLDELPFDAQKGLPSYIEPLDTPTVGLNTVQGLRAANNGGELVFPSNENEAGDLSWIPEIARLSFGSQDIRSECLVHPRECKVSLLVRTWQGDVRACHLAHPNLRNEGGQEKGRNGCGILGPLVAFRIKDVVAPPTTIDPFQAVADAFSIKLTLSQTTQAKLYLIYPDGSTGNLALDFDEDANVTLLIANLPEYEAANTKDHSARCHQEGIDHHFFAYYDLGTTDPRFLTSLPLPQATLEKSPGLVDMECEEEVSLLEDLLLTALRTTFRDSKACFVVPPHSEEACSMAQFAPQVLPSLRSEPPLGTGSQPSTRGANGPAAGAGPPIRPVRPAPSTGTAETTARAARETAAAAAPKPTVQSPSVSPPR
ncbi:MAG TPA: hypothetical protein VGS22_17495 [Thermoanaerobaculia bacterium]|jgi:hypothetical protein|nr:hypothetical protein [Thermoanaerobaculia bacterium]